MPTIMPTYDFDNPLNRQGTDCIKHDMLNEFFGTNDALAMWVADMDFPSPDFVIRALKDRLEHPVLGYSRRGSGVFQSASSWLARQHGWKADPDWMVFTPGVVPGIAMAVQCYTEPGDRIIIQPPVYHPFYSLIEGNGREAVHNILLFDGDRYSLDFELLEEQAADPKTRMMILCNPHNPVGRAWNEQELRRIAEVCSSNEVILVSDEIHADLTFPGHRHIPAMEAAGPDKGRFIISAIAPSKTFNLAGMSSSIFIIPNEAMREKFNAFLRIQHLFIGNLMGNIAMEAAYTHGDAWLAQLKVYLQGNLDLVRKRLRNIPGIRLIEPEATYLLWLDCSGLDMSDEGLREFMIQKAGIALNDGPSFGPGGSGFQRMNIACQRSVVEEAMNRLEKAVCDLDIS